MSMADIQNLLALTRQNGIGWAAWGFEPDASHSLIDASLNPANAFGRIVRAAMLTDHPLSARMRGGDPCLVVNPRLGERTPSLTRTLTSGR
jgi:hypothetical protein